MSCSTELLPLGPPHLGGWGAETCSVIGSPRHMCQEVDSDFMIVYLKHIILEQILWYRAQHFHNCFEKSVRLGDISG